MTDTVWADVDRYLVDLLHPRDDALEHALQASAAAGLPPIAVTPPGGKLLLELDEKHAALAQANIAYAGLSTT
jgi:hypothetical protein